MCKQQADEQDRLELENSQVELMKNERKACLDYEMSKIEERQSWAKWLECCTRPNPRYENQITTYLRQEKDELQAELALRAGGTSGKFPRHIDESIKKAVEKCEYAEAIITDLDDLYCTALEDKDVPRQEWCLHYKRKIRKLLMNQLDMATSEMVQRCEEMDPNPRQEVNKEFPKDNSPDADANVRIGFYGHLASKGFRAKVIDWKDLGILLELPKSIALQSIGHCIGVRALYSTYDWVTYDCPAKQAGVPRLAIGGVLRVDLLSIPAFPRNCNNWVMRTVLPEGQELHRLQYPNEHAAPAAGALQPCKLEFRVPDSIVLRATVLKVSWWDEAAGVWSDDNISEVHWEEETRRISFFSLRLAAFSITQERTLEFPYKWWHLRALGNQKAELAVQANRFEVRFQLTENGIALLGPVLPELRGLMYEGEAGPGQAPPRRVMRPAQLLLALRQAGINLLPTDEDTECIDGMQSKWAETESRAYSDLSEIAAAYDITSSRHNKKLPRDRALCRIRENLHYEEYDPLDLDAEMDYKGVLFWPNKVGFVQSLESVSPCNEALANGHVTHAALVLAIEPFAPQDVKQRLGVSQANVRFVDCVRKTMALLRLLSFA